MTDYIVSVKGDQAQAYRLIWGQREIIRFEGEEYLSKADFWHTFKKKIEYVEGEKIAIVMIRDDPEFSIDADVTIADRFNNDLEDVRGVIDEFCLRNREALCFPNSIDKVDFRSMSQERPYNEAPIIADAYSSGAGSTQEEKETNDGWSGWTGDQSTDKSKDVEWDMTLWESPTSDDSDMELFDDSDVGDVEDGTTVLPSDGDFDDIEGDTSKSLDGLIALFNNSYSLGRVEINGSFARYNDVVDYLNTVDVEECDHLGDLITIEVDGNSYIVLNQKQAREYLGDDNVRRRDILGTTNLRTVYVIDGNGEALEMTLDISDHNIYLNDNKVVEDELAEVIDLAYASPLGAGSTGSGKINPDNVEFISAAVESFSDIAPLLQHNLGDNDAIVGTINYPLSRQVIVGDANEDYLRNISINNLKDLKETVASLNENNHRNIAKMITNTLLFKCLRPEILRAGYNVNIPANLPELDDLCGKEDVINDMVSNILLSLRVVVNVPEKGDAFTPTTVRLHAERNFMHTNNLNSFEKLIGDNSKTWDVPTAIIPGLKGCMERMNKAHVSFDVFLKEDNILRVSLPSDDLDWASVTLLKEI
ncbi:hypothetical protein BZG82_15250 [Salinivibrio sp. PR5]|uniref:hypothetical protein n=1 Tax=Salinivibrio sp. PR5 TaxID=1909484 RepID=UPI000989C6DB|nr:hypothetical protein [Salinivibrio sp. PR5]OOF08148.1 hypothetical protein BZG82_15250 [Salinivibrio sp. PR5]